MRRLILLLCLIAGVAGAQTTTYTGTIKDLSLNVVTSGQVTFTLTPSVDTTIPGLGRFTPTTIACNINVDGSLSGYVAGAVSGLCIVASNTSISPSGTSYRICIQPYGLTPGSCFYDYALQATKDITTIAPTLQTGPVNYNGVPGPALNFAGAWSSATVYASGQLVVYSNLLYISTQSPNLNQNPATATSYWSLVASPTSNISSNAALFSGVDIGAKINAAIAAIGCGTIIIPSGTYTYTTQIGPIPQCVTVKGQGDATALLWHGSGAAIVLSNVSAPGQYVQGHLEGLTVTGTSTAGQIGLYQGGNPSCTGACTSNPSTNIGYNYIVRDVTIYNMDNGIVWGNSTFNVEWDNVLSQNNTEWGWYVPTSGGGGQVNNFYHVSLSGNAKGAWNIQQTPQVTFSGFGMDIEYNGSQTGPSPQAAMVGGTYTCYDCHVESSFGPFVEVQGNNQVANFHGGIWVVDGATTTDPYLVTMDGPKGSFSMDGTLIYLSAHNITNLVVNPTNSQTLSISMKNLGLYDPSYYLKAMSSYSGPGISWCLPYNNSNGTGAGYCYNGNINLSPLSTSASSVAPATLPVNAAAMSWNGDGASGGVDLYDTYSAASSSSYAFRFNANISGTWTPLGFFSRNGALSWNGGAQIPSSSSVEIAQGPQASGYTTLVNGAVSVNSAAACAPGTSCVYKFTNCGALGTTTGILAVGGNTPGASFVIYSLTAANAISTGDQSHVCWQIN